LGSDARSGLVALELQLDRPLTNGLCLPILFVSNAAEGDAVEPHPSRGEMQSEKAKCRAANL
jgi:hypothetical protein